MRDLLRAAKDIGVAILGALMAWYLWTGGKGEQE
jgi:hypothetical protein